MGRRQVWAMLFMGIFALVACDEASAQTFGVELYNNMMPASGGMAGTSIARPQDLQSALGGNPATLAQFKGTQFSFGGAWIEPTINMDNDATLPIAGISPYEDKSGRPGSALGNIAVSQDYAALGMPITASIGLLTASGLGLEYRASPESNGTSSELVGLAIAAGVGAQITDRLAAGAAFVLGTSTLDGPFSGIGAAVPAYGIRGSLGLTYDITEHTDLGFYWRTAQSHTFEDAVRLPQLGGGFGPAQDVDFDFPEVFGWGVANDRLMGGRLLLASDLLYIKNSEADFLRAVWDDQLVVQLGAQFQATRKIRLRMGYAYSEDIMRDLPALAAGGVIPPDGLPAMQYIQAQFPAMNEHRITGGFGIVDFLPGVDLDLFAGGLFDATAQLGDTAVSVESYYIGLGMTWRFQRGACERLPAPDRWRPNSDIGCGLR